MLKQSIKTLALLALATTISNADQVALYQGYLNSTYDSAKNSIMAGATTATAKGYSAMLSNPAGLSTNYNMTIYAKTVAGSATDSDDNSLPDIQAADHIAAGLLYDSFGIEYKLNDYILGAAAYGFESSYGLFSVGGSYLVDQTDLTLKEDSLVQSDEFATGDYLSYGLMWQKSFIDEEHFYAIYIGLSHKNSGRYSGGGNSKVVPVSPSRTSYGLGLETNLGDTSLLITLDMSEESWQSVSDTLSGTSYGAKWMINQKFAIAAGMSTQTFSSSTLQDIQTVGAGLEFGFLGFHTVTAFTQRTVNDTDGVYLKEQALHLDVALTF